MRFGVIIIINMWDKAILQCCSNEAISDKKKSSSFCQMLEKPISFNLTDIPQPWHVNIPTSTPYTTACNCQ